MLHRKKRVNDGFKIGDFDVADKEHRKTAQKVRRRGIASIAG